MIGEHWLQKPAPYTLASILISLGGLLNGFDTSSIGGVSLMPYFEKDIGTLTPIMRGFTVSLIMLTGAVPSVFAGRLADRYGRLPIVCTGASVFFVGAVLEGAAHGFPVFWAGRALCGFGEGLWLSNVSVYITEIAPKAKRGALVSIPQLMSAAGICMGYFTCYGSVHIQSTMSWRVPYVIQAIPALSLGLSCLIVLPSSPRWLILHDRSDEANEAVTQLRIPRAEADEDILRAPEPNAGLNTSPLEGFAMLFRRQYRLRTVLALFILGMVQLSGIDGVLYVSDTLDNLVLGSC